MGGSSATRILGKPRMAFSSWKWRSCPRSADTEVGVPSSKQFSNTRASAPPHKVELEAWVDNARAIALYTSSGFEVEGIRRNHYRRKDGTLRSAMIMAKHLRTSRLDWRSGTQRI